MSGRSILDRLLWACSLLILAAAVCGCLSSAALAGGAAVGVASTRPLVDAYAAMWPCLALLYYAYLAVVEQTPDLEQESATFALVGVRSKQNEAYITRPPT